MTSGTLEPIGFHATVNNLDGFLNGVQQIENSAGRLTAVSVAAGNLISGALSQAFNALVDFGSDAINVATDFEAQMALMEIAASGSSASMTELRNFAIEMGAKTFESAQGAAIGMTNLLKAGLDAEEVMGIFPAISNLAAASSLDLAAASDAVVVTMRTFGRGVDSVDAIVNSLVQSADASVTEVDELTQALSSAGPVAANFGLSFNDMNTALAIMSERGIRGANAGTMLKSMLLNLQRPTLAVTDGLDKLGVNLYDEEGNMRNFADVITDLTFGLEQLRAAGGAELANEISQAVAGTYGIGAFSALTSGGTDMFAVINDELVQGFDAIAAAAGLSSSDLEEMIANDTLGALGIEFIETQNVGWANMTDNVYNAASALQVADTVFSTVKGKSEEFAGGLETIAIIIGDLFLPGLHRVLDFLNDHLMPAVVGLLTGDLNIFGALETIFTVDLSWAEKLAAPVLDLVSGIGDLVTDAVDAIGGKKYKYSGPEQYRELFEQLGPEKFDEAMNTAQEGANRVVDIVTNLFDLPDGSVIDTEAIEQLEVEVDKAKLKVEIAKGKVDFIVDNLEEMRNAFAIGTEQREDSALVPDLTDEEFAQLEADITILETELTDAEVKLTERTDALAVVRNDFFISSAEIVGDLSEVRLDVEAAQLELEKAQRDLVAAEADGNVLLIETAERELSDAEQKLTNTNDRYAIAIEEVETLTSDLADTREDVDAGIIDLQNTIPDSSEDLIDTSEWYESQSLGDVIAETLGIEDLSEDLSNAWAPIKEFFDGIGKGITDLISGIDISGIRNAFNSFINSIVNIVGGIFGFGSGTDSEYENEMLGLDAEPKSNLFANIGKSIANLILGIDISDIENAFNDLVGKIKDIISGIFGSGGDSEDEILGLDTEPKKGFFDDFIANFNIEAAITSGIKGAWSVIESIWKTIIKPFVDWVSNNISSFVNLLENSNVGQAIGTLEIPKGVTNAIGTAWNVLKAIYDTAIKPIVEFLIVNVQSFFDILTGESKVSQAIAELDLGSEVVTSIGNAWIILRGIFIYFLEPIVNFIKGSILPLFEGGTQRLGDDVTNLIDLNYDEMTLVEKAWNVVANVILTISGILDTMARSIEEDGFSMAAVFEGLGTDGLNVPFISNLSNVLSTIADGVNDFMDSMEDRDFEGLAIGAAVIGGILAAFFAPGLLLAAATPIIIAGLANALTSITDFIERIGSTIKDFAAGDVEGGLSGFLQLFVDVFDIITDVGFGAAKGILEFLGMDTASIDAAEKSLDKFFGSIRYMIVFLINRMDKFGFIVENIIAQICLVLAKTKLFGVDQDYWEAQAAISEVRVTDRYMRGDYEAAEDLATASLGEEGTKADEFTNQVSQQLGAVTEESGIFGAYGYFESIIDADMTEEQKQQLSDRYAEVMDTAWANADPEDVGKLGFILEEHHADDPEYDEVRESITKFYVDLFKTSSEGLSDTEKLNFLEHFEEQFEYDIPESVLENVENEIMEEIVNAEMSGPQEAFNNAILSSLEITAVSGEGLEAKKQIIADVLGTLLTGGIDLLNEEEQINLFENLNLSPEAAQNAVDTLALSGGFSNFIFSIKDELADEIEAGDFDAVSQAVYEQVLDFENIDPEANPELAEKILEAAELSVAKYISIENPENVDVVNWIVDRFTEDYEMVEPSSTLTESPYDPAAQAAPVTVDSTDFLFDLGVRYESDINASDIEQAVHNQTNAAISAFGDTFRGGEIFTDYMNDLDAAIEAEDFSRIQSVRNDIALALLSSEFIEVEGGDLSTVTDPFALDIINGVTLAVGKIVEDSEMSEADAVRDWVIDELERAFEIESPSKAMEPLGAPIVDGILKGIENRISEGSEFIESITLKEWVLSKISEVFGVSLSEEGASASTVMEPIGLALVDGILAPLTNATEPITLAANKFATDFVAQLETAFDIRSPSKMTEKTGTFLGLGLIQGFTQTVSKFSPSFLSQPNAAMARNQYNNYDSSSRTVNFNGPINDGQNVVDKMNLIGV